MTIQNVLEVAADEPKSRPQTINLSYSPKVSLWTAFSYWAFFVFRYFYFGRHRKYQDDRHYGPDWCVRILKNVEKRILEQSKPHGTAPTLEVPQVRAEDLSPDEFQRIYLTSNTPVLFKGMAKKWEAIRRWTPEFFKEHYGNVVVPTRLRGHLLKETALRYVDMPLREVVDNLRRGGTYFSGHTEDIFNRHPDLREALDLKTLGLYLSTWKQRKIMSTQLFISGGGIKSGFHATGGPNLFVMVYGRKEWTLVHPMHSMWMYPVSRRDMFYVCTPINWLAPQKEIDKAGFPLYRYAPKYVANLEAGDVLFSPHWWWHAVNTTEPSIGIACRAFNKLILGQPLFSTLWIISKEFRKAAFHLLRTGWGSDSVSGAKLAFEPEQQRFLSKISV